MKAGRGFTLIELVTMMIVIGIIAAYAVGRMDFTDVFEQRGKQDQVKAALQFARKAAVAQRRSVCVCVGTIAGGACTGGDSITLNIDTRPPETVAAVFCDGSSGGASLAPLDLPGPDRDCGAANRVCSGARAAIASATTTFSFDPQGRSSSAANITVTVTGQPGVTVEATTGYVR